MAKQQQAYPGNRGGKWALFGDGLGRWVHFTLHGFAWFAAGENFDFIAGKGWHFIAALKNNRLVALSEEGRLLATAH